MRAGILTILTMLFFLTVGGPLHAEELREGSDENASEDPGKWRLELNPHLLASALDATFDVGSLSRSAWPQVPEESNIVAEDGPGGPQAAGEKDWEFILTPYLLLANIEGEVGVGRVGSVDVEVDTSEILEHLEAGFMGHAEARRRHWGLFVDVAYMKLGDDISNPRGVVVGAEVDQTLVEAFLFHRFELKRGWLDAFAGARYWNIGMDVDLSGPFVETSRDRREEWVDPVLGARVAYPIADRWQVRLHGDIGGFAASSDLSWNVIGTVGWEATEWFSLEVAYRALFVDYDTGKRGSEDFFSYDTITHGPLLGFAFKF